MIALSQSVNTSNPFEVISGTNLAIAIWKYEERPLLKGITLTGNNMYLDGLDLDMHVRPVYEGDVVDYSSIRASVLVPTYRILQMLYEQKGNLL